MERPMTGSDCKETPQKIQQYRLTRRVSDLDKKNMMLVGTNFTL
jgi:hypothetical protein